MRMILVLDEHDITDEMHEIASRLDFDQVADIRPVFDRDGDLAGFIWRVSPLAWSQAVSRLAVGDPPIYLR